MSIPPKVAEVVTHEKLRIEDLELTALIIGGASAELKQALLCVRLAR